MNSSQKYWLTIISVVFLILLYVLNDVLFPFIFAMAIAYLTDPIVDRFEEWGVNRTAAVAICFGILSIILCVIFLAIIPMLAHQFKTLAELGPEAIVAFETQFIPWLQAKLGINLASINWQELSADIDWTATGGFVTAVLKNLTNSSSMLVTILGNMVLVPVVAFYLLRDWDILIARIDSIVPLNYQGKVRELSSECNDVLKAFIRGQLLVMLALATIYTLGLMVVGLKLALLIGLIAGLASIVPYMGFIVGIGAAVIAAVLQFHEVMPIVWVGVVFIIGQMIEGMVLTPLLVGDKIGLHPVAVIFAILAGGQLFGFVGILIALPVAAIIMVLLRHIHLGYLSSDVYSPLEMETESELDEFSEGFDNIGDAEQADVIRTE